MAFLLLSALLAAASASCVENVRRSPADATLFTGSEVQLDFSFCGSSAGTTDVSLANLATGDTTSLALGVTGTQVNVTLPDGVLDGAHTDGWWAVQLSSADDAAVAAGANFSLAEGIVVSAPDTLTPYVFYTVTYTHGAGLGQTATFMVEADGVIDHALDKNVYLEHGYVTYLPSADLAAGTELRYIIQSTAEPLARGVSETVVVPDGEVTITYPTEDVEVERGEDLDISWGISGAVGSTVSVAATLSDDGTETAIAADVSVYDYEATWSIPSDFTAGTYTVTVTPSAGSGDTSAEFIILEGGCAGTVEYDALSGHISDGDGDYSASTECTWIIDVSESGGDDYIVVVTFSSFDLEYYWDKLYVYDACEADSSALLETLTGSSLPAPVSSSGPCMTLVLDTDGSVQNDGFELDFVADEVGNVTVTSCPDGVFSYGETVAVEWESTGLAADADVDIVLLYQYEQYEVVAAGVDNSGAYEWTVDVLDPGDLFQLEVRSVLSDAAADATCVFTLEAGSIEVVAPTSADSVFAGSTLVVEWVNSGSSGSTVTLTLLNDGRVSTSIDSVANTDEVLLGATMDDVDDFYTAGPFAPLLIPEEPAPADGYITEIQVLRDSVECSSGTYDIDVRTYVVTNDELADMDESVTVTLDCANDDFQVIDLDPDLRVLKGEYVGFYDPLGDKVPVQKTRSEPVGFWFTRSDFKNETAELVFHSYNMPAVQATFSVSDGAGGSYSWALSDTLQAGDQYQISVKSDVSEGVSDYFEIVAGQDYAATAALSASSNEDDLPNVVDDDLETVWASDEDDLGWLAADFGSSPEHMEQVVVVWYEHAAPQNYLIEAQLDEGGAWTAVQEVLDQPCVYGRIDATDIEVDAYAVRVNATQFCQEEDTIAVARMRMFGCSAEEQCEDLAAPANGEIISGTCEGAVEGDECVMDCKHGYHASAGSKTRVCGRCGSFWTPDEDLYCELGSITSYVVHLTLDLEGITVAGLTELADEFATAIADVLIDDDVTAEDVSITGTEDVIESSQLTLGDHFSTLLRVYVDIDTPTEALADHIVEDLESAADDDYFTTVFDLNGLTGVTVANDPVTETEAIIDDGASGYDDDDNTGGGDDDTGGGDDDDNSLSTGIILLIVFLSLGLVGTGYAVHRLRERNVLLTRSLQSELSDVRRIANLGDQNSTSLLGTKQGFEQLAASEGGAAGAAGKKKKGGMASRKMDAYARLEQEEVFHL